jgi:hypothetical protein
MTEQHAVEWNVSVGEHEMTAVLCTYSVGMARYNFLVHQRS